MELNNKIVGNNKLKKRKNLEQYHKRQMYKPSALACLSAICLSINIFRFLYFPARYEERLKTTHKEQDDSVDPCDDFYTFACQKWQRNIISQAESKMIWKVDNALIMQKMELLSGIWEGSFQDTHVPAFKQAHEFYNQCCIDGAKNTTSHVQIRYNCSVRTYDKFWWPLTRKLALLKYKNVENFNVVKAPILEIFENVKKSLEEMRLPVSNAAFNRTNVCIGFPNQIFDNGFVREQLLSLALSEMNCWWEDAISAAYFIGKNVIPQVVLPDHYLEPPYFEQNGSIAKNYGALGFVIGHELAHAYSADCWESQEGEHMNKYVACLKQQYNTFTIEDRQNVSTTLNAEKTIKEDFADNVGLYAAYLAYSKLSEHNHNVDNKDFLGYAQEAMVHGKHSPAKFRVIGALQNSPEFAKAYQCPPGSKMNPARNQHKKCLPC